MTISRPRDFAAETASNVTAAGSAPDCARTRSTPARSAHTASCSTAAARNVSAAQMSTDRPLDRYTFASLPTVVVLPVPLTPTTRMTCGSVSTTGAGRTSLKIRSTTLATRSPSAPSRSAFTAATMRSVAGNPTSAEISASSTASMLSTAIARPEAVCAGPDAGASAPRRCRICCAVLARPARIRSKTDAMLSVRRRARRAAAATSDCRRPQLE